MQCKYVWSTKITFIGPKNSSNYNKMFFVSLFQWTHRQYTCVTMQLQYHMPPPNLSRPTLVIGSRLAFPNRVYTYLLRLLFFFFFSKKNKRKQTNTNCVYVDRACSEQDYISDFYYLYSFPVLRLSDSNDFSFSLFSKNNNESERRINEM